MKEYYTEYLSGIIPQQSEMWQHAARRRGKRVGVFLQNRPVVVAATLDNFFSVRAAIFLGLLISVVERTVFSVVKFTCGHSSVFFFLVPRPFGWTCWTLWQQAVRHRMQMVGFYPSNLSDLFYFFYIMRGKQRMRDSAGVFFFSLSIFRPFLG
jgi:hypothetical protein